VDRAPESISNTENWLNGNGDLDIPNESKNDCEADDESDIELGNCITPSDCLEHHVVSAPLNVLELI
jgi:hypothetical protein